MYFTQTKKLPLSFVVNGEKITLADARVKEMSTKVEKNITCTDFMVKDFNLKITAILEVNSDFNASEWYFRFANIGDTDTPVISKLLPFDFNVSENLTLEEKPKVHYAIGGMCTKEDFKPCDMEIYNGIDFTLCSEGGRSSSTYLPFFNTNMGDYGYMMAIGWTGNWLANWKRDEKTLNVTMGMQNTNFKLYPGEDVRTPKIMIMNYDGNIRVGQNKLRQYIAVYHNHILNVTGHNKMPLFAHHWGDTPCDVHVKNIDCMVKNNIDFDYYWIDAAWFGKVDNWMPCVGDWDHIKPDKYPEKFKPITDILKANNKKFLLWFEPEHIASGTDFDKLDDLLISMPDDLLVLRPDSIGVEDPHFPRMENLRNSFQIGDKLINFAKPEAVNYYIDYFTKFIKDNNIDCYRNDANIATDYFFKAVDTKDRQGITEMKWVEGLYKFWDGLLKNCPGLIIDNCASGGRRMDFEMFDRSINLTRTDRCGESDYKQNHSLGLNEWFMNHVTNNAILKNSDIEYRLVSDMTAGLNYAVFSLGDIIQPEPDPENADFEKIREVLAKYRIMQPYFICDYYPLSKYSINSDAVIAYQFHDSKTDSGLVVLIRRDDCPMESATYELNCINSGKKYEISQLIGDYKLDIEDSKLRVNFGKPHSVCCVIYK